MRKFLVEFDYMSRTAGDATVYSYKTIFSITNPSVDPFSYLLKEAYSHFLIIGTVQITEVFED